MKKKIMALILAVLCLTMIFPVAVFAGTPVTITEVTLNDPIAEYEVGKSAFFLGAGFTIHSTDPEASSVVSVNFNSYKENGTSWKYLVTGTKIETGVRYKAVITVHILSSFGDAYCFNNDTVINYDTAGFAAAGVTMTETSRDSGAISLEVIFPAIEPNATIAGFDPETVELAVNNDTTVTVNFSKALPDGHYVHVVTPTNVTTEEEPEISSDRKSCSAVLHGTTIGTEEIEFQLCNSAGEVYDSKKINVEIIEGSTAPDPTPDPTPDPAPDPTPDPTPDPAPEKHSSAGIVVVIVIVVLLAVYICGYFFLYEKGKLTGKFFAVIYTWFKNLLAKIFKK